MKAVLPGSAALALVALATWTCVDAAPASSMQAGERIAHAGADGAPPCISCHGAHGEGNAAGGFPRLAGLGPAYLQRQLAAFASGERKNPVMAPIAKALKADDAQAVSGYFASLSAPASRSPLPLDGSVAAQLVHEGRWAEARLPACVQCHGPDGAGVGADFPPLQGQPAAYIAAQLRAWQEGSRPPGPQALMQAVAKKLGAGDIDAVSHYLAGEPAPAGTNQPAASDAARASFSPPAESKIPNDDFGRLVRLGRSIFTDTKKYAGGFVGNDLRCSNCHIDAGRLANSAPLWGAYVAYPQYRAKTKHVDSYAERLQGCFRYSMNGKAPPLDNEVLAALVTYSYWLATGAPVHARMPGAGYPKLEKQAMPPDYARGQSVYAANCALCHGGNGEGQASGNWQVFPPLWGPRSFNWGAGMHQVNNAAGFIKANMPLGAGGTLTDQQAWDVAYFMDAHERPQDPRYVTSIAETRKRYHDSADSLYGLTVNGRVLGAGAAGHATLR